MRTCSGSVPHDRKHVIVQKNHCQQSVSGTLEAGSTEWVVLPLGPLFDVELSNQGSGNGFALH